MVNPYLLASALLKAFDDGLDNKLDPGEPESKNIYDAIEGGKDVDKLPLTSAKRCTGWPVTMS